MAEKRIEGEMVAAVALYTDGEVRVEFRGVRHLTTEQLKAIHEAANAAFHSWNPDGPWPATAHEVTE